ncbi:glycosyltransferase family A protein [Cyanobium sp. La Preciosa 7G6]|nr:glycosyltransferase family A protein [Cyanobium sp. La Preciosa 7G6]
MLKLRLNNLLAHQSCAITVITPTFKRLDALAEAIASVRAQEFQDWEHLIVADGHDPDVERLVSSYADKRLVYISTKPFHCSGNHQRNVALAASKAKYVYFLDDDNILYPHALGAMLAGFEAPDVDYVVGPSEMDDHSVLSPSPNFALGEIDTLNFMIRRKACGEVGGWRRIYFADFLLIDSIRKRHKGKHLDIRPVGIHR